MEEHSETGSVSEASVETWPLGPASCTGDPDQSFSAQSWQSEHEASESTALNSPSIVDGIASFGRSLPVKETVDPLKDKKDKEEERAAALNDEVERSILELLDVVKACRRKSQAADRLEFRPVVRAADPQRPQDEQKRKARPKSAPGFRQAPLETRRSEVAKPRLRASSPGPEAQQLVPADVKAPKSEDPVALARIEALQSEATLLRAELRQADLEIQAVASACAAANADLRESRLRHQQWHRSTQEESFRLRREKQRLERSCQQAGAEERRIADAQSQSATSQKLAAIKAACEKLELENQKLERELEAGKAELSSARDVKVGPHAGHGRRAIQRPPSGLPSKGARRALTPPARAVAEHGRLQHDSSMPLLRRGPG